ncbi:u1 small nuclear ribonucleoprotein [Nannochloropsis oceanica]
MPRYFCDYCQTYLTHDSAPGRKQHNRGWKHRENVKMYYEQYMAAWEASKGMPVGGSITMPILPGGHQSGGMGSFANTGPGPMLRPPGAIGGFPPGVMRPGMPPPGGPPGPGDRMMIPPPMHMQGGPSGAIGGGGGGGGGMFPLQQQLPPPQGLGGGGPQGMPPGQPSPTKPAAAGAAGARGGEGAPPQS